MQVMQWLAHAHKHNIGNFLIFTPGVKQGVRGRDLPGHLGKRQVPYETCHAGHAKTATEGATHLAGHAKRHTPALRYYDRLYARAVAKYRDELLRTIYALSDLVHLNPADAELRGEPLPEGLRYIGHGVKIKDTAPEDPPVELFGPVGLFSELRHKLPQFTLRMVHNILHTGFSRPFVKR